MNLPDEKREAVAEVIFSVAIWDDEASAAVSGADRDSDTFARCRRAADALAPLLAGWPAEARVSDAASYAKIAQLRSRAAASTTFDIDRWMARHADIFEVPPGENRYCLTDADVERLQSDHRAALDADAEESQ